MIDASKEILEDKYIDAIVCGVLDAMLTTATDQLGSPIVLIGAMFSDLCDENILAVSKKLESLSSEWKSKIQLLEDEVRA